MAHKKTFSKKIRKALPLILMVLVMGGLYLWLGFEWLNFEVLKKHHKLLKLWSEQRMFLSALLFILIYALVVGLSIPGGALLSILGGILFPQPLSSLYVVIGATLGASLLFAAAKSACDAFLKRKASSRLSRLKKEFKKESASYLLFLRLVPLFPFWLVNLAAAFFGTSFRTFVWTTSLGIIPGAVIFTEAGRAVSSIFDHKDVSVSAVLNLHMQIALIAMGLFALLPVVVKWVRKKKRKSK